MTTNATEKDLAYIRTNLPIPEYYICMFLDCITVRLTNIPTGYLGIRPWVEVTRMEHGYDVVRCELREFAVEHRETAQHFETIDDVVAHLRGLLVVKEGMNNIRGVS